MQLAKVRISDEAAGFAQLTALLTEHGDSEDTPIPVAIETSRGLLVACLRATGRPVYQQPRPSRPHHTHRHGHPRPSDHRAAPIRHPILRERPASQDAPDNRAQPPTNRPRQG
ncbi:hypothetical protein ACFU98_45260 [Streptomyces sp. NPDC057575]